MPLTVTAISNVQKWFMAYLNSEGVDSKFPRLYKAYCVAAFDYTISDGRAEGKKKYCNGINSVNG